MARVVIAVLLSGLYFSGVGPAMLGAKIPELYAFTSSLLLAFSGISLILHYSPTVSTKRQAWFAVTSDLVLVLAITYASGGARSGLGLMLAASIALASLSLPARSTFMFASLATLGLLGMETYGKWSGLFVQTAYTQAGINGAAFLAIAFLGAYFTQRLGETEELAQQRGEALANLAELNELVLQRLQTGVVAIDKEGRIRAINDTAWQLLNMPDADPGSQLEHADPALCALFQEWSREHGGHSRDYPLKSGDRQLRVEFTNIGDADDQSVMISLEDAGRVTEQAQQLKLASLGQLTASIAHEIRNPLGAIGHAAQLLDENQALPTASTRLLDIIRTNVGRVNTVIENTLALSRRPTTKPRPVRLLDLLSEVSNDFRQRHQVASDQVVLEVEPEGTTVRIDRAQVAQALAALCDNAVDHFERDHKELRLNLNAGISHERRVPYVEIRDNGPGITREVADNIFDPFFTTRNAGTGLGLYIARVLAEANGIRLTYRPAPLGGSCFRFEFPSIYRKPRSE